MQWLGIGNDRARDRISDHAPVYVIIGDAQLVMTPFPDASGNSSSSTPATRRGCIDLNQAPKEVLVRLVHVGPALAQDIIDGRPWPSVDTLVVIDGIGEASLADIRSQRLLCEQ